MTKTIVITGASQGIGAAIARAAARDGYQTVINYFNSEDAAKALEAELREQGFEATAIRADVSKQEDVVALFAAVDATYGPVDVLIANAGVSGGLVPIEELEFETIDKVMKGNVYSVLFCVREAVRRMSTKLGGRGGSIVTISSIATKLGGQRGMLAYTTSKGAVDSMTLGLSKELADTGIRINSLRPGLINTPIQAARGGGAGIAKLAETSPLRRVGQPEEVADAALWLASDNAAYVHGATIDIAGGR